MHTQPKQIAWDSRGGWVGTGLVLPFKKLPRIKRPHLAGCDEQACGRFICSHCRLVLPWCHGSRSDSTWCDACRASDAAPLAERVEVVGHAFRSNPSAAFELARTKEVCVLGDDGEPRMYIWLDRDEV
jgi:hypothetical protein